jgi:hypothetical protein
VSAGILFSSCSCLAGTVQYIWFIPVHTIQAVNEADVGQKAHAGNAAHTACTYSTKSVFGGSKISRAATYFV